LVVGNELSLKLSLLARWNSHHLLVDHVMRTEQRIVAAHCGLAAVAGVLPLSGPCYCKIIYAIDITRNYNAS
jgi:hypothetical protein